MAAGIVADGATATSVSTAANGRQTVNIARAISGVSYNTYGQFNVGKAGADFNNAGINARNIVNQVTGTNPSLIEGPMAVLGPRANIVLANPNGITVNGGSFINTGNVALTTGQVSFHDFDPAPGQTQRNVIIVTSQGRIEIGPEGLSGAMLNLELIAKNVRIDGPVKNTFGNANAGIRVVGGSSNAEIDGSVSPTDNLTPWVGYANPNAGNPGATVLDITALGSLTGGRISLVVTDEGAGVRHAGTMYANVGDFILSGNGDLTVAGGRISAAKDVLISTAGMRMTSDGAAHAAIIAENGGLLVDSTSDIVNIGGLMQGATRIAGNAASSGAVTLKAAGNIQNASPTQALLGAIFGKSDDVVLQAGGNVINRQGRILSNAALHIDALGDVENLIDKQAGATDEKPAIRQSESRRWLVLDKKTSTFDIDYGQVGMPDQLAYLVAGTTLSIKGHNVTNRGGEIAANNGSIDIVATNRFQNMAVFDGNAHFRRECLVFCRTRASSTVQSHGGLISASQDVNITAGSQASNIGGRVLALGKLTVTAPQVLAQGVTSYSAYWRDRGLKAWFGDSWARLYAMDVGGTWIAYGGKLFINGQGVVDGGSFSGAGGVETQAGIKIRRTAGRDPVTIENHLGISSWLWK